MMALRVLILFAHPALEKSRIHRRLLARVAGLAGITVHDLYEEYPELQISVAREQALLREHDVIVFQHPFYWYSSPAILKQWQDLVLEQGFAFGENGTALRGKRLLSALSTGGPAESYRADGGNRFTINELLAPFTQTAFLCGMEYLPPFVIHGAHGLGDAEIDARAAQYAQLLVELQAPPLPAPQPS